MPEPRLSKIPGFHTLLEGDSGAGKTTALRTLVTDCGLELFVIFTEPSQAVISDLANAHFYFVKPTVAKGWETLHDMGTRVHSFGPDTLQKASGTNSGQKQFLEIVETLNNFVCSCHGQSFGDVESWGTNRVLALDGLSRFSDYVRALMVGDKTLLTQPEWGIGMNVIHTFIRQVVEKLWCHLVMVAHLEYEKDDTTGTMKRFPRTLGRKLGPTLPEMFNDAVLVERNGLTFIWNSIPPDTIARAGFLPLNQKLNPTFKIILDAWKAKGGIVEP